jgi:sucrose-6-phosphate hydrolase SacC (GH32 family)
LNQLFSILIIFPSFAFGQIRSENVDTFCVFKSKSNIPYRIYLRTLFPRSGSFSYNPEKMNHQDSLVIEDNQRKSIYLKVYDRKKNVIFYRSNKSIKRIETWANYNSTIVDSVEVFGSDSPDVITAKYFNRNGKLKKQIENIVEIYSTKPLKYCYLRRTIKFKKDIHSFRTKDKNISCYN